VNRQRLPYNLLLKFRKHQLFLNLISKNAKKTLLFVSMGLLRSMFTEQKSFRKNKILKYVMAKQLRKVLIILGIKRINVIIKSTPTLLQEFFQFLLTPSKTPIYNPLKRGWISGRALRKGFPTLTYFTYLSPKPFNTLKQRKRGRIKRKILRKVLKQNREGYVAPSPKFELQQLPPKQRKVKKAYPKH